MTSVSATIASKPRRQLLGSTPDRLRVAAIVTAVLALAVGIAVWLAADRLVSDTETIADSTGAVLITTQQVNASLAEAETAARAVHLAGADGDRVQRRIYEDAIERASVGMEQIAAAVGPDERSHTLIAASNADLAEFAGLVESARDASIDGDANAGALIARASALMNESILPQLTEVTERADSRYAEESSATWFVIFVVALVALAVILVIAQLLLLRRFHRLLNIPLLLASVLAMGLAIFVGSAYARQQDSLNNADTLAYQSIQVSDAIQRNAFQYQSLVLSGGDSDVRAGRADDVRNRISDSIAIADTVRDQAMALEVETRWNRFRTVADDYEALVGAGNTAGAIDIARGPFTSSFNGFNIAVEAALLENREQFSDNLARASRSLRWMRALTAVGAALIALLTWWGFSLRIGEYR